MTKEQNQCINCGKEGSGNFCVNCGQKLESHTLTWKYVASDFMDRWMGLDTKFGRTVIDLFKYPDQVMSTYIKGNSVKYIGPLGYYIVMSALMLLLFEMLGITVKDFMMASNESMGLAPQETTETQAEFQQKFMQWISDNFRVFSGMIIPFLALSAKVYYRKHTYLHHLVRFTYIQAHTIWVTFIMITLYSITSKLFSIPLMFVSTGYLCWAMMKCYPQRWKVWGFLKGLLVWITGYIFFIMIAMIIGGIIGILMVYLSKS
ncbi:MAG: hypothetical protein CMB80_06400 [Flammeovirgaceae bacterium]|nr:hypothetical protein [Flammeovirgaceae bacterium]MBR09516.1 hypothetical protein [Rickettsiales bacterium]HCX24397.1 hypothetical protein [Cytophagales bacterium]|tara:strand:+ start:153 stop:935 length:783 start_codon:yes stop_codon:yes gene_type:complete